MSQRIVYNKSINHKIRYNKKRCVGGGKAIQNRGSYGLWGS